MSPSQPPRSPRGAKVGLGVLGTPGGFSVGRNRQDPGEQAELRRRHVPTVGTAPPGASCTQPWVHVGRALWGQWERSSSLMPRDLMVTAGSPAPSGTGSRWP